MIRRADPALLLVSVYVAVTGVVADAGVLRAVGLDLDLRTAARLRRTVLDFLRAAFEPKRVERTRRVETGGDIAEVLRLRFRQFEIPPLEAPLI